MYNIYSFHFYVIHRTGWVVVAYLASIVQFSGHSCICFELVNNFFFYLYGTFFFTYVVAITWLEVKHSSSGMHETILSIICSIPKSMGLI